MAALSFVSGGSEGGGGPTPWEVPHQNPDASEILDAYSAAVIGVVDAVSPAVIGVTGRGDVSGREWMEEPSEERPRGGSGSGVVVTTDGLALTNSHVVGGRKNLVATTVEGDRIGGRRALGSPVLGGLRRRAFEGRDAPSLRRDGVLGQTPGPRELGEKRAR